MSLAEDESMHKRRTVLVQLEISLLENDDYLEEDADDSTTLTQGLTETKDLEELTRKFQTLCSEDQSSVYTMIKITATTTTTTSDDVMVDWTSQAALQFVESISLMNFQNLLIDKFVLFPFPLLQLFMTRDYFSRVTLRNQGFMLPRNAAAATDSSHYFKTTTPPFQGIFRIVLDDGPVDWAGLAGWLTEKVECLNHPPRLHFSLGTTHVDDSSHMEDYQHFLKTVGSFPTRQISMCAISLPTSPALLQALEKNIQEEVDLVFSDMIFSVSSNKHRLSIHDCHGHWEFSTQWLEKTLKMMNDFKSVSVKLQSTFQPKCQDFFNLVSSVQCNDLRIFSKSLPSWLISQTLLQQLKCNSILQSLDITMMEDDGHWMIHDEIISNLKSSSSSSLCKMELEVATVLPELTSALEDVLANNTSLSCLKLRKCVSGIPSLDDEYHTLTPKLQMYLGLNQNIHRQIICHGEQLLTPRQWVDSLIYTKQDNLIHLSCIYMTLRKYSGYIVPLAGV